MARTLIPLRFVAYWVAWWIVGRDWARVTFIKCEDWTVLEVRAGVSPWWDARWSGWRAATWLVGYILVKSAHLGDAGLMRHEAEHVRQWRAWGILFPAAYLFAGVLAVLRGEKFYGGNTFERAARDAEKELL